MAHNLEAAEATFNKQVKMAMGTVDPAMIQQFIGDFAGDFAEEVTLTMNPKRATPGAKVTGSFADVMGVMGPYWEGFSNTRVVNESFAVQKGENPYDTSDDAIAITQKFDNHLVHPDGSVIAGTQNKWFPIVNTVTYDGFGLINTWITEFDADRIEACRSLAISEEGNIARATRFFDVIKTLGVGQVTNQMRAEFGKRMMSAFAPKFTAVSCPGQDMEETTVTGNFGSVMVALSSQFNGFVNTEIKNVEIGSDVGTPDKVEVKQLFTTHLLDAGGNKVKDSEVIDFPFTHTLTYVDGKITNWVRDFDMATVKKCRAAKEALANDIVALAKATWEAQRKMAYGDVSPEMFAKFAAEFAGNFAPSVKVSVNPKSKSPGPTFTGSFADSMGILGPIWMGFVNTKIINKSYKKHGNDTVIIGQKYDNHLLDEFGAKIKGTESKWFNVTHTLHYTDGLIDGWIQEFANERLVAVRAKAKQIKDDSMVHARITTAPIKDGMMAEALAHLIEVGSAAAKSIKGILSLEFFETSATEMVAVSRWEGKAAMMSAAPTVAKVMSGLRPFLAGKPEADVGKVAWAFKGAGSDNAKGALRIMHVPLIWSANEEDILAVAEGPAVKRGMKSLVGLVSVEVLLLGEKMVTISKYSDTAKLTAATPKVKNVLAPMKAFMAGPPSLSKSGVKVFSFKK